MKKHFKLVLSILTFILYCIPTYGAVGDIYTLAFKGRGDATTVENVVIENLTTKQTLTLWSGTTKLALKVVDESGVETTEITKTEPKLYPNPTFGESTLDLETESGCINISIYTISGSMCDHNNSL